MKISVIIPVFNGVGRRNKWEDSYLVRCVKSIVNQTFTNSEIIIIDDGSTDNTVLAANSLCERYANVHLYRQSNQGVTKARAYGISMATGDYITFVDVDDTLPPDALENLSSPLYDKEYGIIFGKKDVKNWVVDRIEISAKTYTHEIVANCSKYFPAAYAWGALIKRSLFNDFIFDLPRDIKYAEDWIMHARLSFSNNYPVLFLDKKVYNYNTDNIDSCTNTMKLSANYWSIFYPYLKDSIPRDIKNEYLEDLVLARTRMIRRIYYDDKNWVKSAFHLELLEDIKQNRIELPIRKSFAISRSALKRWIYRISVGISRVMVRS